MGLLALIFMMFKIRHTSDDTGLRKEMLALMGCWLGFNTLQYFVFIQAATIPCKERDHFDGATKTNQALVFWIIVIRDMACCLIMLVFQCRADRSHSYFSRLLDNEDDPMTALAI